MLNVSKVDLWSGQIENRPGGLLARLEPLVKAGADLDFLAGRAVGDEHGGVIIMSPITGQRQQMVAEELGLRRNEKLFCLRLEGPDEPGFGYRILFAMASEKLNVQEVSASTLGGQFVMYVAFGNAEDADQAANRLRRPL